MTNGVATAGPTSISLDEITASERMDAMFNLTTGLGVSGKDHTLDYGYTPSRQLSPRECYTLFEEDPIFARGLETIPLDATRNWISIRGATSDDDEDDYAKEMMRALKDLRLKSKFFEALKAARGDGGSAIILGANDGQLPSEPLELDRVQSLDFVNVVTRWEIQPLERDDNPASPTFREPQYYSFTSRPDAGDKIHASRVLRFRGLVPSESPQYLSGGSQYSNQFWGVPLAQHVRQILEQFNSSYIQVAAALKNLNEAVFSIEGLAGILALPDGRTRLMNRLETLRYAQSQFKATVLDGKIESYERRASTVVGLDSILVRYMELLAAAFGMPLTKLFGTAPSGLSTDDKSGNREWSKIISSTQQDKLLDPLTRVVEIMFHAKQGPTGGKVPEDWEIIFNPLDEPDEGTEALTRKTEADTDAVLILNGVISEKEARSRLYNDPSCPYTLDAEFDAALDEMKDAPTELPPIDPIDLTFTRGESPPTKPTDAAPEA